MCDEKRTDSDRARNVGDLVFGHWLLAAVVLFLNAGLAAFGDSVLKALKLFVAALGTSFANAHSFLGLASEGGYLESCRLSIEKNDHFGLLAAVGVVQAIIGSVFLFLLLVLEGHTPEPPFEPPPFDPFDID